MKQHNRNGITFQTAFYGTTEEQEGAAECGMKKILKTVSEKKQFSDNPKAHTDNHKCYLCGSRISLTFHHLIPKTCHSNKWFRKKFTQYDMKHRGITVCRRCHAFIHKQFSEKELGRNLNTPDKLINNEIMARYIRWAIKQK